ncbi:MAG: anaerobic glycerol-3-phosphate dehydrogenase subunit C [Deltaproteobacteria bacterium]|nr:anaerobic glycerol-3-phosphate dehydrogenase subunit C [Deltaproteobacteria bacterium]
MAVEIDSELFWNQEKTEEELRRVSDVCNGCRRCYNLCPSFNDLFERLDQESVDGDADKLGTADFRSVTDLCYQCKLCYNHCPYTPPHRWEIDFPDLLMRSKAVQVKKDGQSIQDYILGQVDRIGRFGTLFAPLANWANRNRLNRWLMEKFLGIHRDRILATYASQTFQRWFDGRRKNEESRTAGKVALFYTCTVNYNEPETGKACVEVLEKNQLQVNCPKQVCCGMPFLDGGDLKSTQANARANVDVLLPLVEQGYDVVVPGPTCSYMLKREYPLLLKGDEVRKVTEKTFDISEYLMKLHSAGKLDTHFTQGQGQVAYQMPCHLRAQNMGYKSRDLMELIPDTKVQLIEKCSAIDGTWGLKQQYFDLSRKVAAPLVKEIQEGKPDLTVSDCPLAGLQIEQGTGKKSIHPIRVLARAYGLEG